MHVWCGIFCFVQWIYRHLAYLLVHMQYVSFDYANKIFVIIFLGSCLTFDISISVNWNFAETINSVQKITRNCLTFFLATLAYLRDARRNVRLCKVTLWSTWASKHVLTCEEKIAVISLMASGWSTLTFAMQFKRDPLTFKTYAVYRKVTRKTSNRFITTNHDMR